MWTHEHEAETDATPEQIWAVLSDVDHWTAWDTSMETIALEGPFAVGSTISMTPSGQEAIRSTIVEISENERYADETEFGGVVLRFSHTLSPLGSGTRIVHRLEISGPSADQAGPQIGPSIVEDFPEAMSGLIAYAKR
jgi:Polyketide cyclase / dehydrase and lipid transport